MWPGSEGVNLKIARLLLLLSSFLCCYPDSHCALKWRERSVYSLLRETAEAISRELGFSVREG